MTTKFVLHPDHKKPSHSIIHIDPQLARRVLARNTRNRPIRESHVVTLMREMESGRWKYNGEAIKWSIDNVLLDGQHRLTALSRLPDDYPPVPFLVVRGLTNDSQDTMDQGRTRTAADQLSIDGLTGNTNHRMIAGAIRVYLQWERGHFFLDRASNTISNPEIVTWAHEHPIDMELVNDIASQRLRRVKIRPSVTLAVMLKLRQIDGEAQREFAECLYTGANLDEGSPILTLRERFDRLKQQNVSTTDRDAVAFFIVAWNAWRDGRRLTKLQRPKVGTWTRDNFPEPR
ncbi:hypothetical protein [Hoyosella altamirensis]|uniref:ParB/Sulfiredoxin domain-containing protein n=1 Tax=Hoyosella altamirensis TaxID=616997 RepID=A0A839RU50_9ACTN|nr:hypothetical protein [Hoyosella altamirensis]MBB3039423.1 hypothetical protein [Hoyosella altamirensis]MBB3039995.1 hypothetical protein [Hoyosella altamirensis]